MKRVHRTQTCWFHHWQPCEIATVTLILIKWICKNIFTACHHISGATTVKMVSNLLINVSATFQFKTHIKLQSICYHIVSAPVIVQMEKNMWLLCKRSRFLKPIRDVNGASSCFGRQTAEQRSCWFCISFCVAAGYDPASRSSKAWRSASSVTFTQWQTNTHRLWSRFQKSSLIKPSQDGSLPH